MQQERFDELSKQIESEKRKAEPAPTPEQLAREKEMLAGIKAMQASLKPLVELSTDLSNLVIFLTEAVKKIESGGKSRPRSIAITKIQEAGFWLMEEMRLS